jgi:ubiquinone/menaquinone biosynthesis C-methylase UbiE
MITQNDLHIVPLQEIHLERISSKGPILDVGGGGEGLVSRVEGSRVCSVDIKMNKIREAHIYGSDNQWIASDARRLCFAENSFSVTAVWFSLGYFGDWQSKKRLFSEIKRVLEPEGVVSIIASRIDCKEERFLFNARFLFPDGDTSQVGYQVKGNQEQTIEATQAALEEFYFKVTKIKDNEHWFMLEASLVQS